MARSRAIMIFKIQKCTMKKWKKKIKVRIKKKREIERLEKIKVCLVGKLNHALFQIYFQALLQ